MKTGAIAVTLGTLLLAGCSSGSKSNQWSGGGDTYGDGVSGLQDTAPATPYWSGSGVTILIKNATSATLKVEPYEATAGGVLLMPLAEYYMVQPWDEDSREVRLPRQPEQDYSVQGRTMSITISAVGSAGGLFQSWIVPAGQNLSLKATPAAMGGVNLSYADGRAIQGQ